MSARGFMRGLPGLRFDEEAARSTGHSVFFFGVGFRVRAGVPRVVTGVAVVEAVLFALAFRFKEAIIACEKRGKTIPQSASFK